MLADVQCPELAQRITAIAHGRMNKSRICNRPVTNLVGNEAAAAAAEVRPRRQACPKQAHAARQDREVQVLVRPPLRPPPSAAIKVKVPPPHRYAAVR